MNTYIREVSRSLSALGVQVDVFTRRQGIDTADVVPFADLARVIHVPAGPPRYLPKEQVVAHLPEFICNMREFVVQDEAFYDLVHSHYWLSGRVAGYFKNVWRRPMAAMFHTLAELKNQVSFSADEWESDIRVGIERLTVATADRLIASTTVDAAHLEAHYEADPRRMVIVPCGVDFERFSPGPRDAARRSLVREDERLVLFVGRIQQIKGIDLLLRATALLAAQRRAGLLPPFRVLIVGGRPGDDGDDPEAREIQRLKAMAAELGAAEHLEWVGAIDHDELPRFYRAADVTVIPSTYESFGLVALESMACGTPVVAAAVGGLQASVEDGRTGYLIGPRDPALYARRIADLVCAPAVRDRLGGMARVRAVSFGWQRVAARLLDVYEEMVREEVAADLTTAIAV